jgi:uncharacterized Zn finger protein
MSTTVSEVPKRLLIRCPVTNETVSAVLRLRPSAFEALQGEHAFRCEKCGQVHQWRRQDAWLEHQD